MFRGAVPCWDRRGTAVHRVSCRWIECGLEKVAMREVGDQQPKRVNDDSCSANAKQALKLDAVAKVDDMPRKARAQAQAQSGGGFAAGPCRARDRKLWSLCRRRQGRGKDAEDSTGRRGGQAMANHKGSGKRKRTFINWSLAFW